MKKILTGLAVGAISALFCFCLTGCGSSATAAKFGDIVETEVATMTVQSASLGIALGNSVPAGYGTSADTALSSDYMLPKEYDSVTDKKNGFCSSFRQNVCFIPNRSNLHRSFWCCTLERRQQISRICIKSNRKW